MTGISDLLFDMTLSFGKRSMPDSLFVSYLLLRPYSVEVFPFSNSVSDKERQGHNNNHALFNCPLDAVQSGRRNLPGSDQPSLQDTEETVRQSYIKAQRSGVISFTQIPRGVTVDGQGIGRWDPFELQNHHFRKAHLDDEKSKKIQDLILAAKSILPKSTGWTEFAEKHSFDAESVDAVIFDAFCSDAAPKPNAMKEPITEFGCGLLERARCLDPRNVRATKLAKLLGCAVMCVSEYLEGGFKHSAGNVSPYLNRAG